MKLLKPLETSTCPFRELPPSNERPHWVRPTLVAQVKFTEWTEDGRLRHPVYLGLRDDKKAAGVVREPTESRTENPEPREPWEPPEPREPWEPREPCEPG